MWINYQSKQASHVSYINGSITLDIHVSVVLGKTQKFLLNATVVPVDIMSRFTYMYMFLANKSLQQIPGKY